MNEFMAVERINVDRVDCVYDHYPINCRRTIMHRELRNVRLGLGVAAVLFGAFGMEGDAFASRDRMQGEVSSSSAFVQTFSSEHSGSDAEITAQIKIKNSGSYVVVGGFYKGDCWHKGWLSGTRFYDTASVNGEAGDVITVKLKAFTPPMNKNITVGVFQSISDICTKG